MPDDIVAAALASGLFKKKEDPKSKRVYYVNTKTKKSTWKLTPEIVQAASGAPGVAVSSKESDAMAAKQQEMLELRRKRLDLEAQMRAAVALREKQKLDLELELVRLEGPTEAETEELEEMRKELSELKVTQINIEKEQVQKMRSKQSELQKLLSKIVTLEAVTQNEKNHREAVQRRHDQLVEEGTQLKSDIEKERNACDVLRASVEAAKQKVKDTEALLEKQAAQIAIREEELQSAIIAVRKAGETKQEIIDDIAKMEREIVSMNNRLDKRVSYAQHSLDQMKNGSQYKLEEEIREVEAKKKRLIQLQRVEQRMDEIDQKHEQNTNLRQIIARYTRDKERLEEIDRFLQHRLAQARRWVMDGKAESLRLFDDLQRLENIRNMMSAES
eukprot:Tbor_TRINITY_DN4528_c0_g1::TRINITY_DN4528_c0_g1_i1::g.15885::m.15885